MNSTTVVSNKNERKLLVREPIAADSQEHPGQLKRCDVISGFSGNSNDVALEGPGDHTEPLITNCPNLEADMAAWGGRRSIYVTVLNNAVAGSFKYPPESVKVEFPTEAGALNFQKVIYRYAAPRKVIIRVGREKNVCYVTVMDKAEPR